SAGGRASHSGGARSARRRARDSPSARRSAPRRPWSRDANSRAAGRQGSRSAHQMGGNGMRAALLVTGISLVLFFTGLGWVPFYTRGEPREALVAREMLRTGEWLVPSRPEGELTRKPPLFYWVAASALTLFPDRPELAARLPSAVLG